MTKRRIHYIISFLQGLCYILRSHPTLMFRNNNLKRALKTHNLANFGSMVDSFKRPPSANDEGRFFVKNSAIDPKLAKLRIF